MQGEDDIACISDRTWHDATIFGLGQSWDPKGWLQLHWLVVGGQAGFAAVHY